ncbi:MAG: hypothetical protein R2777_05275 [Chitinophagales bacterium]
MVDRLLELSHQHVKTEYLIAEPNCLIGWFNRVWFNRTRCSNLFVCSGASHFLDEKR